MSLTAADQDYLTRLSRLYDLPNSPDWQALLRHFELGEGFAFVLLLVPTNNVAEVCRAALDDYLRESGKHLTSVEVSEPEELGNLAGTLLNMQTDDRSGAIWVARAVPEEVPDHALWFEAWREAVTRLNQYRNPLRRQFNVPVIFCGSPWLQTVVRENAPDLWSIRDTVVRIDIKYDRQTGLTFWQSSSTAERGLDPDLALRESEKIRGVAGRESTLANLLTRAGDGFAARHEWPSAIKLFSESLEILKHIDGSANDQAGVGLKLGNALYQATEDDVAAAALVRARGQFAKSGEAYGVAKCDFLLGEIAVRHSDPERARLHFEDALPVFRSEGDVLSQAGCLVSLGALDLERDDYGHARTLIEEALTVFRQRGDYSDQANCVLILGVIAFGQFDLETAHERFVTACALYRRAGDLLGEAAGMELIGDCDIRKGNTASGKAGYLSALQLFRSAANPYWEGIVLRRLARISMDAQERDSYVLQARAAWKTIGRDDLIQELDREFSPQSVTSTT